MSKIVKITKLDIKKAEEFALLRFENHDGLYARRGAFKAEDIIIGALGEIAAYKLLKPYFKVRKPDFTLHNVSNKSYNSDLNDGNYHFHVKGQGLDSAFRYGVSWILQRNDPLIRAHGIENHFIIPCLVDIKKKQVEIFGIFSTMMLCERGCIGECKNPYFRTSKVAIYKDHLDSLMSKHSRWSLLRRKNVE